MLPRSLRVFGFFVLTAGARVALAQPSDADRIQLEKHQQRWNALSVTTYVLTYEAICECPSAWYGPLSVLVQGDSLTLLSPKPLRDLAAGYLESEPAQNEIPLLQEMMWVLLEEAKSVKRLFATISNAIAQGAARLEVEYDETYGYPRSFFVDPDAEVWDDEWGVEKVQVQFSLQVPERLDN